MLRTTNAVVFALLLVAAAAAPAAAAGAAASAQTSAYTGANVTFDTSSNAIVDYSVNGETVLQSVDVQSKSAAQSSGGISVGVALGAVTNLTGATVSLGAETDTAATVTVDSGASVTANDNERGVLVVASGGEDQYVQANLSSGATVESESDSRVLVTTDDGTEGAFLVVGEGEVTANENDNVSADVASDSKLVFRAYSDGRSDADAAQEELITEGHAAAEVYVQESSESGGELATNVVNYSQDTTVEVTQQTEGEVAMTAERAQSEGKVVLTTVSEQAIESYENFGVTVDGEAAAEVSSYSELEGALGGDTSKYMVRQQSSASASADVLVAVSHFSTREITMSEDGSSDGNGDGTTAGDGTSDGDETTDGDDQTTEDGSDGGDGGTIPGFTGAVALVALAGAALIAVRRH